MIRRPWSDFRWRLWRVRANARRQRESYGTIPSFALEELPRDHQALDLAGAFANGAQLDVAIELFDRIVLGETVTAVDLHRLVGGAHRNFGSKQFGHGRLLGDALPVILHPTGAIREQARGVDLSGHVGELVLNGLKLRDGPAELDALLGVFERSLISALRGADRERGDGNAPAIQNAQAVDESLALLAQQLRFGHTAIGEYHFTGGAGAHAELVFLLAELKTGNAFFKDERGNAVVGRGAVRDRHGHANVRVAGIGGEHFAAVDHPASAVLHRFGSHARGVGAGFTF